VADPGNADLAITVGSTHREEPHRYGVSYFSSKGPTSDGRLKPDVVAPGERIISCAAGAAKEETRRRMQGAGEVSAATPVVPVGAEAAAVGVAGAGSGVAAAASPAGPAVAASAAVGASPVGPAVAGSAAVAEAAAAGASPPPAAPDFDYIEDSGTSMAAPHVSGVIAAFMSIRREFIGEPEAVSKLVVSSAMDLRREPRLQGAGLVDLFKMLQSV
jgi:hypothetical protein